MFYSCIKTIAKLILKFIYRVDVYGTENIPTDGRLIVCSNHASNWDPIFISIAFPRQISWMGKKELFQNKIVGFLLAKLTVFPVDRDGSDLGAIKNALRILKEERVLGLFPEGTRVKSINLDNAKSGVALLGVKSKSPVLPVYIESNYKFFNRVNIFIGKPINLNEAINGKPSTEDYLELSKKILSKIYGLKSNIGGN
ncbi:MAG: lysophospholipid acyltransferase family protein [Tissierellaceae bacterium]|nr:lysophospholipid acyltransferase family protein [Tissierellaceae bacterium]